MPGSLSENQAKFENLLQVVRKFHFYNGSHVFYIEYEKAQVYKSQFYV